MKYLIALVVLVVIVRSNIPSIEHCDLGTATNAISVRTFHETTTDPPDQPVIISRFFHNKLTIFTNEIGRCYLNFFEPNFIADSTTLLGFLPWLYLLYKSFSKWVFLIPVLAVPLIPIFISPMPIPVAYAHKVFAIIGLMIWSKSHH